MSDFESAMDRVADDILGSVSLDVRPGDAADGPYADVVASVAQDHPWVPGALFTRHPRLADRLADVLRQDGLFRARLSSVQDNDTHLRVQVFTRETRESTWASAGSLTFRAEEAHRFLALVGDGWMAER